ncbi:MAG: polysulfide [Actinobacteria bacterium]|nr:MAG: polysulfide [Actinomycetota bacterium]
MTMTEATTSQPGIKRFIGMDWNIGALKSADRRYWSFVALLGILITLGVMAWILVMTKGGTVMAQRDGFTWGIWFANYMFYVGLAAGGLVVYASVHLFGAEQFRPLARLAVLMAGCLTMIAVLGDLTDLVRVWRIYWFALTPNLSAIFVYTGSAAGIYMVICFVDLWILITGKGGEKLAYRMTLIALPLAIYLHTTTAFVLALNKSRELWSTAVMVPIFLTSAVASGVALLLIVAYIMQRFHVLEFKPSMFRSLSTLLATVMIFDLFLLVAEIAFVYWPSSAKIGHTLRFSEFLTGPYAGIFLPVLILGGTAFALLSRRKTRHIPAVQVTASALYVVAIFFKRYTLMSMGFAIGTLGQPQAPYFPSLVEGLLALGLLALAVLFVTLAAKVLPLRVPEHEHGEEVGAPHAVASGDPALESGAAL